jgi:hypothetical protein
VEAWKTYTPDGRMLEVEYANGDWVAVCEGERAVGASARAAIMAAIGPEPTAFGTSEPSLAAWVAEHAAQLEAEAEAG